MLPSGSRSERKNADIKYIADTGFSRLAAGRATGIGLSSRHRHVLTSPACVPSLAGAPPATLLPAPRRGLSAARRPPPPALLFPPRPWCPAPRSPSPANNAGNGEPYLPPYSRARRLP